MNIKELKSILKENNINFYTYWDKKRLVSLANEHNLLPKTEIDKEKSENVNYDRLKTIKENPRKVMLNCSKIYRSSSSDDYLLGKEGRSLE